MAEPTVTAYIPCFQVGATLDEAIASVLNQTVHDLELLVVVDTESTDDTATIARRRAAEDPRVRVIDVPHCNLTVKYQRGVDEARGTWLAPLDGDDVWLPTRLERQLKAAAEDPAVTAWGCWYQQIGPHGNVLREAKHGPITRDDFDALRRAHEVPVLVHSGTLMRRCDVLAVGGYDHSLPLAADFDLISRLGDRGPVLAVPEVLIRYRMSTTSASLKSFWEQSIQLEYVWDRRRRADLGSEPIDLETYRIERARRPFWVRANRFARERSRFAWRRTATALADDRSAAAAAAAVAALAWHPPFTVRRGYHQFIAPRLGRETNWDHID